MKDHAGAWPTQGGATSPHHGHLSETLRFLAARKSGFHARSFTRLDEREAKDKLCLMLDLLSDILTRLSLRGTLYFRTSFTEPWGVRVPAHRNVARFHFAHRGEALVRVEGQSAPITLAQGDLVIVPHGAAHVLSMPPHRAGRGAAGRRAVAFKFSGARHAGVPGRRHSARPRATRSAVISPWPRGRAISCSSGCHLSFTCAATAKRQAPGWRRPCA